MLEKLCCDLDKHMFLYRIRHAHIENVHFNSVNLTFSFVKSENFRSFRPFEVNTIPFPPDDERDDSVFCEKISIASPFLHPKNSLLRFELIRTKRFRSK